MLSIAVVTLILSGCTMIHKEPARETIFDKVVNIPKELILDIPYLPPLCDQLPGLKKGFADIEGGKLYYEEEGQGIPLVLLNPGPGGSHHYYHPHFSQAKDFAHIIYYDARGTGKSSIDDTGETYTIRQAVEDVENLRKALKIEKWFVLGWSFGGFLAQCYALTYPQHVIGLVLVAASDGLTKEKIKPDRGQMFISKKERDAIQKAYKAMHEGKLTLVQAMYNAHLAGDWKRQSYYKPTPEEFIREALYEWSPAPGFNSLMSLDSLKISLDGKFDNFEIPTLITEAKWDLTWNTDKAEFMRKNHPNAQFEYFEKSGHGIFADEPEKFFSLLKNFLEKSIKAQIAYKPGNRLLWPKPLSPLACKLVMIKSLTDKKEAEKKLFALYEQAISENVDNADVWQQLFHVFLRKKGHFEKGLEALKRYESFAKTQDPEELQEYGHCIKAWQGQLLDLLGRHDEAVKCYQEILQNFKVVCNSCDDVDKKWLEEHIKKPFTLD